MKTLAALLFLFSPLVQAADCRAILAKVKIDTVGGAYSFNRWALPEDLNFNQVLDALIEILPEGRPILMFDTNPSPEKWHGHNIAAPGADLRFAGRTYESLSEGEREILFSGFADRIETMLRIDKKPIVIVDHHFRSELLSDASTTPLMVDFLSWLVDHPEHVSIRRALRTGVPLRDHSDADIVLANFALSLLDRPAELKHWGPMIRRIALLNDHAFINPNLSPRDRFETEIGLSMAVAYEKLIPMNSQGGFQSALDQLPRALEWVKNGVSKLSETDADPLATFLKTRAPFDLKSVEEIMRIESKKKTELSDLLQKMFATNQDVTHSGRSLTLRFRTLRPSGLDTLQYLKLHPELLPKDVKVLVMAGTKIEDGRESTQVKLRVTDPNFSLDNLFSKIEAKGLGGGGRASAGSLYGISGVTKSEADLATDLEWLQKEIEKL